jgi:hypothetical protein
MPITARPPTTPPTIAPTGAGLPPPPPESVEVLLVLEVVVVVDVVVDDVVVVLVVVDRVEVLVGVGELRRISCPANCELSQLKRVKMLFGSVLVAQKKVTQYG